MTGAVPEVFMVITAFTAVELQCPLTNQGFGYFN